MDVKLDFVQTKLNKMATRITDYFVCKVKKHLKDNDIPFMNVNDSKNLMILRPAGNYHYLVIQFFEMLDLFPEYFIVFFRSF